MEKKSAQLSQGCSSGSGNSLLLSTMFPGFPMEPSAGIKLAPWIGSPTSQP